MLAEIIFTPVESKYFISRAIVQTEKIQNALNNGIIACHPCSTGFTLFNEITGRKNTGKVWLTGMIVEKGLCIEANTQVKRTDVQVGKGIGQALADPGLYPHTMVLYKGEEVVGWTIYDLMERMGPGDIYVKGVNAVDANHRVGVLLGSLVEGTIGKMLKARDEKHFEIICPVGLEKYIPGTVEKAAGFISDTKDYSMGQKVRMRPLEATVITEIDAAKMIADVEVMQFAAGGVKDGAGTVCLAVKGEEKEVRKIIEIAESVKGKTLPEIYEPRCIECAHPTCYMAGIQKPWVKD